MADSMKDRERVKEEEFFERQNREMLQRLRAKDAPKQRISPTSGQPMERLTVQGVSFDYCRASGYIGLDIAEFKRALHEAHVHEEQWIADLLQALSTTPKN